MKSFFTKFAKHKFKLVFIICAIMVIGVIGLCVWDHVDPPLWYHFEAQKNKRVIMEYAEEHFPEAKIVEEHYNSAIPFQTSNKFDYIIFNQDGVQFSILANDGRLLHDNYLTSKASQYIKREIIEPFIMPRNITAEYDVYFMGEEPIGSPHEYEECIYVNVFVKCDKGIIPEEIVWFYDFYLYWIEYANIKNYDVTLSCGSERELYFSRSFNEATLYQDKHSFYQTFKYYE